MYGEDNPQSRCRLLYAADSSKSASHATRQKESAGRQDLLEIHRRKIGWIAGPVSLYHCADGIRDQRLKREEKEKDVIHFAEKRYEVGNDVDRQKYVGNRTCDNEFVDRIDAT